MSRPALSGTRIRALRTTRGLSQTELARLAGVSPSYLNLIEYNRRRAGKRVLQAIATALEVTPDRLAEDAGTAIVQALQGTVSGAAASDRADPPPEMDRAEELAGRFPGWAAHLVALAARNEAQARVIERLSDRMAHDPNLSAALHEIVSAVTAVQSTAAILADTQDLEPEWRARFHRNVHADSQRLATAADALVAFLDTAETETGLASPLEELEAWLAARGYHLPEIEAPRPADWPALVAGQADLASAAARELACRWLAGAHADARALPLDALHPYLAGVAGGARTVRPEVIAHELGVGLAQVLRRLACLPPQPGFPGFGLVICDGSGTLTFRRPIEGFAMPRFAGACPIWPLYQALSMPGRPLCVQVECPGQPAPRFLAHAVAELAGGARFNPPWALQAVMLLTPTGAPRAAGEGGASATELAPQLIKVGSSCRVCPRPACHARREPAIVGG
ncbi:MAG: short-chain fatty acyl-CoA regulator family protein [Pararhodobacter sp.]